MIDQPDKMDTHKARSKERNMLQTAKGGGFLAAGTIFAFGSRFAIAFLLARLLGAEQYGVINLSISIATVMASISTFGLDSTMVRYVAVQAGQRDEAGVWGTLQIGVGFSFLVSTLMSIGLYFQADTIAVHLFHEPQLVPFFQLYSLIIPFMTVNSVLTDVARGFKRMDYSALAQNGVLFVVRMILIGILALIGLTAFRTIVVYGLAELAVFITFLYLLNKEYSFKRPLRQGRREYREIFAFALPFWMSGLLTKFRKNIQTLLLGTLNTVTSVGIFAIVNRLNLGGRVVYSSVVASVKPVLAELYDQDKREQMRHLYQTTTRWTFTANLPIFLIMLLYPGPLLSIFGESFTDGALALTMLACGELANAGTGICGSIIDMTGRTKLKLANSVIWVTLILSGNVLLIPRWGVLGTATATSAAIAFVNLLRVLQVWFLYGLQPYNVSFLKPISAGLTASVAVLVMARWLPADVNLLYTIFHVTVLLAVYAGALLLLGLAPEERTVLARMYRRSNFLFAPFQKALAKFSPAKLGAGKNLMSLHPWRKR